MQKLILGFLLSLGLIVSSFANEIDLISLATNGAYNEQSKGVKVLNDEEMSEVVGGRAIPLNYQFITPTMTSYYWLVDGRDLSASLNAEIRTLINTNTEVLIFARRHYYGRVQTSWLMALNPNNGYTRDLSFISTSTRIFQHLNRTTPTKF